MPQSHSTLDNGRESLRKQCRRTSLWLLKRRGSPIWNLFIELMNMLYIGIYGVHFMEFIYYIMKLKSVAMPASELGVSRWAGEQTLILGGPCGDLHSDRFVLSPTIRGTHEHSE